MRMPEIRMAWDEQAGDHLDGRTRHANMRTSRPPGAAPGTEARGPAR